MYIYTYGVSLWARSHFRPRLLLRLRLSFRTCAISATVETKSTAEQPDADMGYILAVPGDTAGPTGSTDSMGELMSTATNAGLVQAGQVDAGLVPLQWEIQVEHSVGMWWTMPYWLSDPILQELQTGSPRISYIWDWKWTNGKDARNGSYKPNGQTTSINRYIINFDTMYQKNTDKPDKGDRKVKIVSVIR